MKKYGILYVNSFLSDIPFSSSSLEFFLQESSETSSAGTDGNVIYFCPDFLIKTFQDDPDTLEKLFLHMLYHCLFLHLILEIPSDAQRWDQACDLAVYRLIHHEKKRISSSYTLFAES